MRRSAVGTAGVLGRRVGSPAESAGLSGGGDAAPESEPDSAPSGREGPHRREEAAVEQQKRRSREPRHVTARKTGAGRAQNSQRSALRARGFL